MAGILPWMLTFLATAFVLLAAPSGAAREDDTANEGRDRNHLLNRELENQLQHQPARQFASRKLLLDHSPPQAVSQVDTNASPEVHEKAAGTAAAAAEKNDAVFTSQHSSSSSSFTTRNNGISIQASKKEDLFHIDYTPAAIHPPHSHSRTP